MTFAKILPTALLATTFAIALPAEAKDPCATVMCMFGKLKGVVVAECEEPIADYFDIVERHHGDIKPDQTANARKSFLDQCEKADPDATQSINDKFGKVF
ncbi:TrbM/KikA/MpfK family conjugal transfer protein [Pseudomonas sp. NPDC089401]|uniref:TrbM/KikA/MpfK family conjugal transfer protein n=1 Tax=Pseudomonas sp. NPDC089401 TaxID=3364462 RepID=UPI0037F41B50